MGAITEVQMRDECWCRNNSYMGAIAEVQMRDEQNIIKEKNSTFMANQLS